MSEQTPEMRSRDHLRLVQAPDAMPGVAARPRTIGRLIAQTALIADSAVQRRRMEPSNAADGRSMTGRLFGRFR